MIEFVAAVLMALVGMICIALVGMICLVLLMGLFVSISNSFRLASGGQDEYADTTTNQERQHAPEINREAPSLNQ